MTRDDDSNKICLKWATILHLLLYLQTVLLYRGDLDTRRSTIKGACTPIPHSLPFHYTTLQLYIVHNCLVYHIEIYRELTDNGSLDVVNVKSVCLEKVCV